MKKPIPTFKTDKQAEGFVATADLYDTIFPAARWCASS
jgi:hypothetical protein